MALFHPLSSPSVASLPTPILFACLLALHWVSRSQGPHIVIPLDGGLKILKSLSAQDSQAQVEWYEEDSPAITTSGWSLSY